MSPKAGRGEMVCSLRTAYEAKGRTKMSVARFLPVSEEQYRKDILLGGENYIGYR